MLIRRLLCFFVFDVCLWSAFAAEVFDSVRMKAPVLNEVVISSSKEGRKLKDLPSSVTLLASKELQNWNVMSMKDISAVVPNLFFPDYGSKLTSPVYIRGIGSKINSPSIGLYVDGIPYFEKSVFDFEFNDVERIEVLRGPQGTLYGRNTMGGIIHVITKNPLETQGGKISLIGGNYGQRDLAASYYGRLSPVFGYSFSGKYSHSDGYFTNQYTGKKADKTDAASGSGKLVWKMTRNIDISVHANYDYLNQNGYPYALIDSTGKVGKVNYDSVSSYHRKIWSAAYVMNRRFSGVLLRSVTGLQRSSDRQAIDQDFSVNPTYFVTQEMTQRLWTKELELRSARTGKYDWLLGFFAFWQSSKTNLKVNTLLKDYDAPSRGFAFYHQSMLNNLLVSGLSLTAGLRYDYEHASQDYLYQKPVSGVLQTLADLSTKLSFSQWSPKLSLQYHLCPSNLLYVSVTKGYKTGGFNTSFDTEAEQTFQPEYSWNYEIGNKYGFFNNRIAGEWSLFYTDWRNQQISQPLASGVGSLLRNAGQSYSAGAEFSLQAVVLKNWNAQLNYGYTEAKFVDYVSGTSDYSNNYIPYVPRHTLMLGSDYTLVLNRSFLDKAVFSCQYVETGKLYWNDKNAASQDTYGTWNGKVSLQRRNLMLDFWVKNLTATDYTAFYFEMSSKSYGQKGKPTTMGATLTVLIP
jgi:iron complex outermembrane recepter protein